MRSLNASNERPAPVSRIPLALCLAAGLVFALLLATACDSPRAGDRPIGSVPPPPDPIEQIDPRKVAPTPAATPQVAVGAPAEDRSRPPVGDRWALVIGLSKYQYAGQAGLTNLAYADEDALNFSDELRRLGWRDSRIKVLTNQEATRRNILIALESWLTKAGPNDLIVLYWSGHGFPDPDDPERVYFACYDTDITIPATGYRMDQVRQVLRERNTRNVVLLADTCHAGGLITRSGERAIAVRPYVESLKKDQSVPKGWVFMVGADTDRLAVENSSWTNGAFTHVLIQGLRGEADGYESAGPKDGIVTMGELRAWMQSAMPDLTHKTLGTAKHPVITTSSADPEIWNLTLQSSK
jgi:hypothetical protein